MSQTKAQLIDTLVASLLPASDSSVDIGSNAVRFANIYGDTLYGSGANLTGLNIVTDTSPQLGGNLDVNTKNILFGDSSDGASDDVLIFGAGSDLKIYHSGSHSIIQETGTGNLLLCGTRVNILNSATSETLISAQENGPVELYYDNSKKLETKSTGIQVTGTIEATEHITINDNKKLFLGNSNDLQIYHDGTNSILTNSTGNLQIKSTSEVLLQSDASETMVRGVPNNTVELRYDNVKKLETTSSGVTISGTTIANGHIRVRDHTGTEDGQIMLGTGNDLRLFHQSNENIIGVATTGQDIFFKSSSSSALDTTSFVVRTDGSVTHPDNIKMKFGTSDDLKIHHDGSNSYIDNNTGALNIRSLGSGANVQIIADNDYMARFVNDGAVELYYDNTKMFRTYASGVIGDQNIWVGSDNYKLLVGGSADLQIYHNGTHSFIDENQNGNLVLRTNPSGTYAALVLQAGQENSVICHKNGNVELYYDNVKKLETTSTGINVSGNTSKFNSSGSTNLVIGSTDAGGAYLVLDGDSNGDAIGGDYAYLVHATDGDLEIHCDNPNGDSRFELYVGNGATQALIAEAAGAVKLYHDNTQRFETVSNGFRLAHSTGNVDFHFNRLIVNAGQTFFIDHTATGADFQIRTSDSSGLDTTALQILGSGCLYNRCRSGSQANLTLRKQLTGADGIDYLQTRNQNNNLRTAIKGNGGISNYQSNDTNLSDETMKKNIVDCESIIEKFKQWKLRKFNYNSDVDGTPLTYGLIAQEIETLHSDLVSADFPVYESGEEVMKKTVKDHQLMMLSFKALQEAIAKIEVLEAKVAALEAA